MAPRAERLPGGQRLLVVAGSRQTRLRSDEQVREIHSDKHLRGLEERPAQLLDAQFEAIQTAGGVWQRFLQK